ncbi:hypothetical protein Patl1_18500 [Pistacia atlantica]|uniref:Uncharacterized protein n=1 Tax=Pistacia atlantica TaxID=434234 RepID=A0ACC1C343_9ROSI|nr:hypothetical protein Patl1_18500 [Pistacia atlantica]
MVALTHNSLIYSENLTLPTFQVIVMNANMRCAQCRQRVSQVTSKIKGEEFNPVNYIFNIKPRERILNGEVKVHAFKRLVVTEKTSIECRCFFSNSNFRTEGVYSGCPQ